MSSLVAFFPRDASMPVATAVAAFYAIVLLLKDPYIRRWDDTLSHLSQVELFLFCSASYVLYTNPGLQNDPAVNVVLSMALIALTFAVLFGFLFAASHSIRVWYLKTRRNLEASAKLAKKDGDADTSTDTSTGIVEPPVVGDYSNSQQPENKASIMEVFNFLLRRKPKQSKSKSASADEQKQEEVEPASPSSSSTAPAASSEVELSSMSQGQAGDGVPAAPELAVPSAAEPPVAPGADA